jgi:hypothetical protein
MRKELTFMEAVKAMNEGMICKMKGWDTRYRVFADMIEYEDLPHNWRIITPNATRILNEQWYIDEPDQTLSDKVGDVTTFPHHEVLMLEDIKEAIQHLITWIETPNKDVECPECPAKDKPKCKQVYSITRKIKEIFGERLV